MYNQDFINFALNFPIIYLKLDLVFRDFWGGVLLKSFLHDFNFIMFLRKPIFGFACINTLQYEI